MPLSWNEIRKRAIEFSQEYANATRENAETQSFYNEFFNVFGISRRRVASFEEPVKKLGDIGNDEVFINGREISHYITRVAFLRDGRVLAVEPLKRDTDGHWILNDKIKMVTEAVFITANGYAVRDVEETVCPKSGEKIRKFLLEDLLD